jgi:hypothetical protein
MVTEIKNKNLVDKKIEKYNSFVKWQKEKVHSIFMINNDQMQSILNKF